MATNTTDEFADIEEPPGEMDDSNEVCNDQGIKMIMGLYDAVEDGTPDNSN